MRAACARQRRTCLPTWPPAGWNDPVYAETAPRAQIVAQVRKPTASLRQGATSCTPRIHMRPCRPPRLTRLDHPTLPNATPCCVPSRQATEARPLALPHVAVPLTRGSAARARCAAGGRRGRTPGPPPPAPCTPAPCPCRARGRGCWVSGVCCGVALLHRSGCVGNRDTATVPPGCMDSSEALHRLLERQDNGTVLQDLYTALGCNSARCTAVQGHVSVPPTGQVAVWVACSRASAALGSTPFLTFVLLTTRML